MFKDMEDIMEAVAMDMEAMEEEDMVIMLEVMVTKVEAMGDIMGDTENDWRKVSWSVSSFHKILILDLQHH